MLESMVRWSSSLLVALWIPLLVACDSEQDERVAEASECDAASGFEGCSDDEVLEAIEGVGAGKEDNPFIYESGYTNVTLVGETTEGLDVVAILGRHSVDYPYWGSDPWDNILLMVGEQQLVVTEEHLSGFSLDGFGPAATGRVHLDADMFDADGLPVAVSLSWELVATPSESRLLGLWPLGVQWSPSHLRAEGPMSLALDGVTHELSGLHGVSEVGDLKNLKDDNFATQYDALFVLPRPSESESYAFVDISARTLPISKKSALLDPLLEHEARVFETFDASGSTDGNPRGVVGALPIDESVIVFEDVVDAGLASVRRQVVRLRDKEGRRLWGLRDVFVPH